ncbi:hypothetical protein predicted by Glimmer/Critica [Azoarcus olearius]|uniref:Uncharacterized protein n=1 Tax=Azoarcus sp. (strain BH72) TaxID=418699 RepID=A1K9X9_AZOSB|nr:hypothetical protein predicted by Glimmer/Critica [Azoarcus olearius]
MLPAKCGAVRFILVQVYKNVTVHPAQIVIKRGLNPNGMNC